MPVVGKCIFSDQNASLVLLQTGKELVLYLTTGIQFRRWKMTGVASNLFE